MKLMCERCQKEITKEDCPFDDAICENCCKDMLLGSPSPSNIWNQFDFDKGDFR